MRRFRSLLVVAVALAFAVAVQQTARADDKAADKAGKKAGKGGKKKGHAVHGTVIAVKKDKDKDEGTITVRVHHRRKKGDTTASKPVEKVFKVTSATKFQKVSGTRGDRQLTSATFADLHKGEHVAIVAKGDTAEDVKFHAGKGKGGKGKGGKGKGGKGKKAAS